ncbi:MAG: bifunctional demethylmenaquinone methyltransferase/2-methoxy-6-polyprenyl-1,4-benzoquinol methylase UbiE [Dehalococcoidia bacterium]|nr:bifunctional demethylmenaquinone methyltransferase/2-methoxy-6-polyprenyl-1,4-benzoquinol methylase UbiE [Dehalococcoidia bacterium]
MSKIAVNATETNGSNRAEYVSRMFGRIAPRYDLMNSLMTLGQDRRWRRLTAALATPRPGGMALDLGTGSGELAFDMAARGNRVVAMDFCQPMMDVARQKVVNKKGSRVYLVSGDALSLPFPGATFNAITAGFAFRNFADLARALDETLRVLKPGGRLAVLELTPPRTGLARLLHGLYSHRFVPLLGRLISGDSAAYTYLPNSVDHFPDAETLRQAMVSAGFRKVSFRRLGLGMVAIHLAEKGT